MTNFTSVNVIRNLVDYVSNPSMPTKLTTSTIPFNHPFIIGSELSYIEQAVQSGKISADGDFSRKCEAWLVEHHAGSKALLTHSCTAALEMAALLCEIEPGQEVIMPSYTFVSTANAFLLRGANIRFVDIRPDTLNLDESLLDAACTPNAKVVVPVHYAGVACEMDAITAIARKRELYVIEDAAQAVSSTYKGKPLGSLGDFGCFSFHETKNMISGEGGALLVRADKDVRRAEILREKGTDRAQFFRGEIDKYTWRDIGSSYGPSELIAAFLMAQLECADTINAARLATHARYMQLLQPLQQAGHLRLPIIPEHCGHNAHMFYVLLRDEACRSRLISYLADRGISAVFHYIPLHTSPMGKSMGYGEGDFPVTEEISQQVLRLPCFYGLTEDEQDKISSALFSFFGD